MILFSSIIWQHLKANLYIKLEVETQRKRMFENSNHKLLLVFTNFSSSSSQQGQTHLLVTLFCICEVASNNCAIDQRNPHDDNDDLLRIDVMCVQVFMLRRASDEPRGHAAAIMNEVLLDAECKGVINASQKKVLLQQMALHLSQKRKKKTNQIHQILLTRRVISNLIFYPLESQPRVRDFCLFLPLIFFLFFPSVVFVKSVIVQCAHTEATEKALTRESLIIYTYSDQFLGKYKSHEEEEKLFYPSYLIRYEHLLLLTLYVSMCHRFKYVYFHTHRLNCRPLAPLQSPISHYRNKIYTIIFNYKTRYSKTSILFV